MCGRDHCGVILMTSQVVRKRYSVLGVPIIDAGQAELVQEITTLVQASRPGLAVGVNAQVANFAASDDEYLALLHNADVAYADGASVVWAGRILGGTFPERCATTDLVYPLMEQAAQLQWRVFFFGAAPGVADKAAQELQALYPSVRIKTHHGYIKSSTQHRELLAQMAEFAPHLIFVGLGEPAQQEWVAQYRAKLPPAVVLTCGGLFDWISGAQKRPPTWVITAGLEWLWRLLHEPTRLWRRYVLGNPVFIARFCKQLITTRRTNRRN